MTEDYFNKHYYIIIILHTNKYDIIIKISIILYE